jgi:cell division protein FtsN
MPFLNRAADKAKASAPQADRNLAEHARTAEAKSGQPERPRFDFYKILPGQEEPVTERDLKAAAKAADKAGVSADLYFVQAGAFQNPADADNLKARLALIGLMASVEPASLPDRGTWYRVRLGPYNQLEEINRVRATLAQNGVDASLVRIKN